MVSSIIRRGLRRRCRRLWRVLPFPGSRLLSLPGVRPVLPQLSLRSTLSTLFGLPAPGSWTCPTILSMSLGWRRPLRLRVRLLLARLLRILRVRFLLVRLLLVLLHRVRLRPVQLRPLLLLPARLRPLRLLPARLRPLRFHLAVRLRPLQLHLVVARLLRLRPMRLLQPSRRLSSRRLSSRLPLSLLAPASRQVAVSPSAATSSCCGRLLLGPSRHWSGVWRWPAWLWF